MSKLEHAMAGYDDAHEQALVDAITKAIADTSLIPEPPVLCLRTGETARALMRVLVLTLAMSPSSTRSPGAIRKLTDELRRRLIKGAAEARQNPLVNDFVARAFRDDDHERGGNA
jgi:hypothetical protein